IPQSRLNCPQASLRFTVSTKSPSPISVIPATDFRSRKSLYCLAITASEGALPRLYIQVEGGPTNSTPTTTLICEGSSRLGLIFQKARQDLRCKIEVGALQTFHSESKIQLSKGRGFLQYSERSHHSNAVLFSLASPLSVVNNQLIRPEFSRRQNRVALTRIRLGNHRIGRVRRGANLQPAGRLTNPGPYRRGCRQAQKFVMHRRRNRDRAVHLWEHFDLFDENQVVDRGGVGDNDHSTRYSPDVFSSSTFP